MTRNIILLCALLLSLGARTQQTTIDFKDISYADALKLSAGTGKPVFIDCYTSWCAPCKWMDQNVFTNDSIYAFFNEHFVNLKIDMEKGEGVQLRDKYNVQSFPTYLFVDSKGEIVHRTASRMEVKEFLEEGKRAAGNKASYSVLKEKYEAGDRSNELLLDYALALEKVNRNEANIVESELLSNITDEELLSDFGWRLIEKFARSENDKPGKFFLQHEGEYVKIAGIKKVTTMRNRLATSAMYKLIREKNGEVFFDRLNQMRQDTDKSVQRNVAMLEMEYYLETNNADSFVVVANRAKNGIISDNDADLSFVARRALYASKGNKKIQNEALLLARKAVELNPEEYSNQGTLASICLELKLKEEGLAAARKARLLANDITSKIQKIAQELLDKVEALEE